MTEVVMKCADTPKMEPASRPFPFAVFPAYFEEATAATLLDRIDAITDWGLLDVSLSQLYQHRFNTRARDSDVLPENLLMDVRKSVEAGLNTQLSGATLVYAHCLRPGSSIRLHTDDPANPKSSGITHRLIVHLNRHWNEDCGGQLVFFGSRNPRDVRKVFPALHNYAVAFALSCRSYHGVTEVHGGPRYTMIFSFWTSDSAQPSVTKPT
jgi:Rps23 Pro-64 3,4-dihydroxylase Tpa1-like proline 4-hydroxylase